jgi:hypothetical protein
MKCPHCPIAPETACRGELLSHYCKLVDPANPKRRPDYARILVKDDFQNDSKLGSFKYPPMTKMAGNLMGAAGRFVAAWWKGEPTVAGAEELTRRLAICFECSEFDHAQKRCPLCGCFTKFKARLAKEHCPLPPEKGGPKW